jgi:hypothetical protein
MELVFLKETCCPECGCTEVIEEGLAIGTDGKIKRHCNGKLWEYRKFLCGFQWEYSPNYSCPMPSEYDTCRQSKKYLAKIRNQQQTAEQIKRFVTEKLKKGDLDVILAVINEVNRYLSGGFYYVKIDK